ncbi:MAG: VUT family protein [Bacteroidales bacterium]|nr:VUT family protein [Bacteroidales bacterium]
MNPVLRKKRSKEDKLYNSHPYSLCTCVFNACQFYATGRLSGLRGGLGAPDGTPFQYQTLPLQKVLGQGINIIIGSITAFLVSQLTDAYTFQFLKIIIFNRHISLRATGSTVISAGD